MRTNNPIVYIQNPVGIARFLQSVRFKAVIFIVLLFSGCNVKDASFFTPPTSSMLPGEELKLMAPTLMYPPNGASDLDYNLTFEWDKVENAVSYDFQIAEDGESFDQSNGFSLSGITSNMYEVEGLDPYTYYSWRVRASAEDVKSPWSNVWGFSTMALPTVVLNVEKEGEGVVTSEDGQINCGENCTAEYNQGNETTLSATPADGWTFEGWSGDVPNECDENTGDCTVVMDKDKTVIATFIEDPVTTYSGEYSVDYKVTDYTCSIDTMEFQVSSTFKLERRDDDMFHMDVFFPDIPAPVSGYFFPQTSKFDGTTGRLNFEDGYKFEEAWDMMFYPGQHPATFGGISRVDIYQPNNNPYCFVLYDIYGMRTGP